MKISKLWVFAATIFILTVYGANFRGISSFAGQILEDPPTLIDSTTMGEKQRKHRRLFGDYKRDRNIRELAATLTEDVELRVGVPMGGSVPGMPKTTLQSFLNDVSCAADAIVVGTVLNKESQITEDGTFIFTDYEMRISKIVKDNSTAPIEHHGKILLTYPGGAIRINDRVIRAEDSSFHLLRLNEEYLLFLKFIPETGAYQVFERKANFHVTEGRVIKLAEEGLSHQLKAPDRLKPLLREVRSALGKVCR